MVRAQGEGRIELRTAGCDVAIHGTRQVETEGGLTRERPRVTELTGHAGNAALALTLSALGIADSAFESGKPGDRVRRGQIQGGLTISSLDRRVSIATVQVIDGTSEREVRHADILKGEVCGRLGETVVRIALDRGIELVIVDTGHQQPLR